MTVMAVMAWRLARVDRLHCAPSKESSLQRIAAEAGTTGTTGRDAVVRIGERTDHWDREASWVTRLSLRAFSHFRDL
jgi:hypothetical protein